VIANQRQRVWKGEDDGLLFAEPKKGNRIVTRMRNWIGLGVVVVAVAVVLGADETKRPKGVFSAFRVGQSVSLRDEGSAFTITFFEPELQQSHKVIEIGDNFIVVRDIAEITETTVPIYAVKAIVKVKTKAR
jgi:hypothetical protein